MQDDLADATEAVLAASRTLIGITARSLPEAAQVTLPQWRALVVIDEARELNVNSLAAQLGITPSTCTRLCDRLVRKGLIVRELAAESRREVTLRLSDEGRSLVAVATSRRRAELQEILEQLTAPQRRRLAKALLPFVEAAGAAHEEAWTLGWAN